jgi:hypothetical protein
MKKTLFVAIAMAFAAPAFGQTPASPPADVTTQDGKAKAAAFAKIDTDMNGALTLAEIKAHEANVTQADFDKYDADKSKSLSMAEFDAWMNEAKEKASPTAG